MGGRLSKKKGITLIALVITIIVLLILAGITISMLVGADGLIAKVQSAKANMELAEIEERESLNKIYSELKVGITEGSQITVNVAELKQVIADTTYPVGSIYISIDETNPADRFGGTWERIEDKFLLASGTTYGADTTGGSSTSTYTPSGTVEPHQLTVSELPSHAHTILINNNGPYATAVQDYTATVSSYVMKGKTGSASLSLPSGGGAAHSHEFTGTEGSIDTMPPYMTVYMWKRVA